MRLTIMFFFLCLPLTDYTIDCCCKPKIVEKNGIRFCESCKMTCFATCNKENVKKNKPWKHWLQQYIQKKLQRFMREKQKKSESKKRAFEQKAIRAARTLARMQATIQQWWRYPIVTTRLYHRIASHIV